MKLLEWLAANNQVLSAIKDFILSITAFITGCVAIRGINDWRKELKGKSEYTLAKEVLRAVYKVREGFQYVRDRRIYSFEYPKDTMGPLGNVLKEKEYEATSYLYHNRFKVLKEALDELEEKHLEAQVEWGPENHEKIAKVRSCVNTLHNQIQKFIQSKYLSRDSESYQGMSQQKRIEAKDSRNILYDLGSDKGENGEFTRKINEAIDEFEHWLRPYISNRLAFGKKDFTQKRQNS